MAYDPNGGGSGDRWNFFQGLDETSPGSGNQGQARTPRISAAGFDIDTGKYHGPSPWDPIGFNPDTGAPIWPGQEKDRSGPGRISLPRGLQDSHPAAKVLWAVQTNQVPHLKGVAAIDEYGAIHPEYERAVGAGGMTGFFSPSEAEAADGRFQTEKMKRVQEDWSKDPVTDWFKEKWDQTKQTYDEAEQRVMDWLHGEEVNAGEVNNKTAPRDEEK